MGLTGMQIFKLLPRTNCKACGMPTCLAFAMKLAQGQVNLADCPDASDEAKKQLGAATEPPIHGISYRMNNEERIIGGERFCYRHDEKFINPTTFAVSFSDKLDEKKQEELLKRFNRWSLEKMEKKMEVEAIHLKHDSKEEHAFERLIDNALKFADNKNLLILESDSTELLSKLLSKVNRGVGEKKVILSFVQDSNLEDFYRLACDYKVGLMINGESFDKIIEITSWFRKKDFKDLIISKNKGKESLKDLFVTNNAIRRAACKKEVKELGYPIYNQVPEDVTSFSKAIFASTAICKYGSLLNLGNADQVSDALLFSLFSLRLNIYTDPQKPLQAEAKIHTVGEVNQDSPLFVTTNFSLTYHLVMGELESLSTPAYLAVVDTEGNSVLTAWAASKFNGEIIGDLIKKSEAICQLKNKRLIIPGYVASIRGELEDALPDWKIIVGPQEASDIPSFVKQTLF